MMSETLSEAGTELDRPIEMTADHICGGRL
jgi:hypothetical protein